MLFGIVSWKFITGLIIEFLIFDYICHFFNPRSSSTEKKEFLSPDEKIQDFSKQILEKFDNFIIPIPLTSEDVTFLANMALELENQTEIWESVIEKIKSESFSFLFFVISVFVNLTFNTLYFLFVASEIVFLVYLFFLVALMLLVTKPLSHPSSTTRTSAAKKTSGVFYPISRVNQQQIQPTGALNKKLRLQKLQKQKFECLNSLYDGWSIRGQYKINL